MHVCFLMQGFLLDPGNKSVVGPLVQTFLLGREMARQGIRVSYIALFHGSGPERVEHHEGIEVHYLRLPHAPMRLDEVAAIPKALALLDRLGPDVVYTRGRTALPFIASRYARRGGRLSVWNAARDRDFNGFDYVRMKLGELSPGSRLPAVIAYGLTMVTLFDHGVKRAGLRIVQNSMQREAHRRRFDRDATILPAAIELEEMVDLTRTGFEVLWISGIKGEKRPEMFLDLAARLRHLPIDFTMAGAMLDRDYAARIEQTAKENPRFRYVGQVPYTETAGLFRRASLTVNTSISEGFPNVYLQSWSWGTPVLTISCDPSNVIRDHELGLVCNDAEGLARGVERLFSDPDELRRMMHNSRGYVEAVHGVRSVVGRLLEEIGRVRRTRSGM